MPARRRAPRATFLLAAAFVMYGIIGAATGCSGAFTAASRTATSRCAASRRRAPRCQAEGEGEGGGGGGGGRPISDFSIGEVVEGRVAFRTKGRGVFCDIGGKKSALLQAPKALAMKLRDNEMLEGLRVTKVDPEKGLIDVTHDNFAEYVKDRYKPVTSFAVDDVVDGRVVMKARDTGVLIDIGAECDAKLRAPFAMAMKLKPNSTLKGLRVMNITTDKPRIWVVFDGLEESIKDVFKPISSYSVGDVVNGRVVRRLPLRGDILVDIDAERSALLDSAPESTAKLRAGDMLEGVRVTEADEKTKNLRVAFDGLEAFLKEKGRM